MEIEPAERQEKIPTESQKEKERGRDCKGNKSLLQLGRKLLRVGSGWGGVGCSGGGCEGP